MPTNRGGWDSEGISREARDAEPWEIAMIKRLNCSAKYDVKKIESNSGFEPKVDTLVMPARTDIVVCRLELETTKAGGKNSWQQEWAKTGMVPWHKWPYGYNVLLRKEESLLPWHQVQQACREG